MFTQEVDERLKEVCLEISKRYEIEFIEIGTDQDHVHFFRGFVGILDYHLMDVPEELRGRCDAVRLVVSFEPPLLLPMLLFILTYPEWDAAEPQAEWSSAQLVGLTAFFVIRAVARFPSLH